MLDRSDLLSRFSIALAPLVSTMPSYATNSMSVAVAACSGARQNAATENYLIDCSGDFTLANGTITSDVKVVIVGVSSLTITNVKIIAPAVELKADGNLFLGDGTEIITNTAQIGPVSGQVEPSFYASNGAMISIAGAPAAPIVESSGALVGNTSSVSLVASDPVVIEDNQAARNTTGGGGIGFGMLAALLLIVAMRAILTRGCDTRC